MGCISHLLLFQAIAVGLLAMPPVYAVEPDTHSNACKDRYSVLRILKVECPNPITVDHKQSAVRRGMSKDEPLELEWLEGEILGFSVIGLGQIRGGTALLSDLWYAAAVLTPPLLKQHPDYGMQLNYLAITPPFVALGLLNGYLRNDHAGGARIFLSNFIGFNLSLLWAHAAWNSPERFFPATGFKDVPRLDTGIFAMPDGAGMQIAYRW